MSINELVLSMRRLQKVSDDTRIQRIMQVLDEDSDGVIDINDALKVREITAEWKCINSWHAEFILRKLQK